MYTMAYRPFLPSHNVTEGQVILFSGVKIQFTDRSKFKDFIVYVGGISFNREYENSDPPDQVGYRSLGYFMVALQSGFRNIAKLPIPDFLSAKMSIE